MPLFLFAFSRDRFKERLGQEEGAIAHSLDWLQRQRVFFLLRVKRYELVRPVSRSLTVEIK